MDEEILHLDFSDIAQIVRNGYQSAALEYRGQKDQSILSLPIFNQWLSLIPVDGGTVIELGSGSGYPLAHHFASICKATNIKYLGVDISEEQIRLANENLKGILYNSH